MMTILLLALALLCGISIGVIIGIAACYVSWTRQANDSLDIDYSGGW
jgi:hypothetical protein